MRIDSKDFAILMQMYFTRPTTYEMGSSRDTKRRIYRLSRNELCSCDGPDRPPRRWALSLQGTAFVERIDAEQGQAWRDANWHTEWMGRRAMGVNA